MTGTATAEGRHLLSIRDLADSELRALVERSVWYSTGVPPAHWPLTDRVVGIYFRKTSTRTRTAFSVAALRLGGHIIAYGPADLQENTGETPGDTARVLSSMLDVFVARTAGSQAELHAFASGGGGGMSVVNGMSAAEHPTQAIADLGTIHQRFGGVDGLRMLYVGEGNNTAAALALALTRFKNTELYLQTPPGYGLDPAVLAVAQDQAATRGGLVEETHVPGPSPTTVDVVYTTRWQTTGTVKPDPDWRAIFAPFQVNERVLERSPQAVFMHDLPAHRGEETTAEVLEAPQSVVYTQAGFKLHSAMAILDWCVTTAPRFRG